MADIEGAPMLGRIVDRLKQTNMLIIIATPDKEIANFAKQKEVLSFLGEPDDDLVRYVRAASVYNLKTVIRITGDCPLIDPDVVSLVHSYFTDQDYVSNVIKRTFPSGLDTEVIGYETLCYQQLTRDLGVREHVTLGIRKELDKYITTSVELSKDYSAYDWRVDWEEDLDLIRDVYKVLGPFAKWPSVVEYIGGDYEPVSITTRSRGSSEGDSASYGDDEATSAGPDWYERKPRKQTAGPGKTARDIQSADA